MREAHRRQPAFSDTLPDGADLIGACFDMVSAMQSAVLASFASGVEAASEATRSVASETPPNRAVSHDGDAAPWSGGECRSWYRRPVETPFGSYMHGSGMFVLDGMFAAFAEAAWKPQADMTMRWMAQMPNLATPNATPFATAWMPWTMTPSVAPAAFPMMPPMWAASPGWSPVPAPLPAAFETHGTAVANAWSAIAESLLGLVTTLLAVTAAPTEAKGTASTKAESKSAPGGFVSYRTSGGHAAANVVQFKNDNLLNMLLPLAFMAAATVPLTTGLAGHGAPLA